MTSPLSGSLAKTIGSAFKTLFLNAVLTRDGETTGPSYDPTPGEPLTFKCKAIRDSYSTGYRSGGVIASGDVKIIILQTSLGTEPKAGDRINIPGMGGPWTLSSEGGSQPAVAADPANATWECRGRT